MDEQILGDFVHDKPRYNLTFKHFMKQCENDESLYRALKLQDRWDLTSVFSVNEVKIPDTYSNQYHPLQLLIFKAHFHRSVLTLNFITHFHPSIVSLNCIPIFHHYKFNRLIITALFNRSHPVYLSIRQWTRICTYNC